MQSHSFRINHNFYGSFSLVVTNYGRIKTNQFFQYWFENSVLFNKNDVRVSYTCNQYFKVRLSAMKYQYFVCWTCKHSRIGCSNYRVKLFVVETIHANAVFFLIFSKSKVVQLCTQYQVDKRCHICLQFSVNCQKTCISMNTLENSFYSLFKWRKKGGNRIE